MNKLRGKRGDPGRLKQKDLWIPFQEKEQLLSSGLGNYIGFPAMSWSDKTTLQILYWGRYESGQQKGAEEEEGNTSF